jgi:uncharacterized protein YpuA (DUF1002 family)
MVDVAGAAAWADVRAAARAAADVAARAAVKELLKDSKELLAKPPEEIGQKTRKLAQFAAFKWLIQNPRGFDEEMNKLLEDFAINLTDEQKTRMSQEAMRAKFKPDSSE